MLFQKKWAIRALLFFLVATFFLPLPKLLTREWTVQVVDQDALPVSNIRVSGGWNNYTFGIRGGTDLYTNAQGQVSFPAETRTRPIVYWIGKATWNFVNLGVHAGTGTVGHVRVTEADREWQPSPHAPNSAICSDGECTSNKLHSDLGIVIVKTPSKRIGNN